MVNISGLDVGDRELYREKRWVHGNVSSLWDGIWEEHPGKGLNWF